MGGGDLRHDGQPEPRSGTERSGACSVETLEDVRQLVRCYSRAVVADFDADLAIAGGRGDRANRVVGRVHDYVRAEVVYGPAQQLLITRYLQSVGDIDVPTAAGIGNAYPFCAVRHERGQVDQVPAPARLLSESR